VNSHFSNLEKLEEPIPALIYLKLNLVRDSQFEGLLFKLSYDFFIVFTSACADKDKLGIFWSQGILENFLPDLKLETMLFFRPELCKTDHHILSNF